jgi:hypothetical protein
MNITDDQRGQDSTRRHDAVRASRRAASGRVTAAAAAAAAVAVAALGLTACTLPAGSPAPAPAKTVTQQSSAPARSTAAAHQGNKSSHASSGKHESATRGLPEYQPSSVVSKTSTSTVLTSPDSVAKIGSFYANALANGGWHLSSSSAGSYHASFTAHRGNQGASISVYPRGGGSGISISTYPG